MENNNVVDIKSADKNSLIDIVRAMSPGELEVVADNIPIDICLKRVEKEILRNKEFIENITKAAEIANNFYN